MTPVKLLPMVQPSGAIDPVCGMTVDPATAKFTTGHGGKTYYFCCAGCLAKFQADPGKYLHPVRSGGASASPQPARTDVEYTCPMHPEVRQIGPGSCPLCGMALEPVEMTAEEPENHELVDMTRRFRVSAVLAVPVLVMGMLEWQPWVQLALATPVV